MTRRWGADQEERAAVVKKAHDAYAQARQALSRIEAIEVRFSGVEVDQARMTVEIGELRREFRGLARQISELSARIEILQTGPVNETFPPRKRQALARKPAWPNGNGSKATE
jgi:chromosome segregation ATPase